MAVRKVILIWGQSNAEGTGDLAGLQAISGTRWLHAGTYPGLWYWQDNILDKKANAGQWTELDFAISRYDIGPPATAFDYPVNAGKPQLTQYPARFGPELEFSRGVQAHLGEPVYTIKLAANATYTSRIEPDATLLPPADWFWPSLHRSWHPALPLFGDYTTHSDLTGTSTAATATTLEDTTETWATDEHAGKVVISGSSYAVVGSNTSDTLTFTAWVGGTPSAAIAYYIFRPRGFSLARILMEQYLPAAQAAAVAAGDTLEVVAILSYIGEGESTEEQRANESESSMRAIMRYMRDRCPTTANPDRIPWVLIGPRNAAVWTYAQTVIDGYKRIAADDPYVTFLDSTDYDTLVDLYHHDAQSMYDLSIAAVEAWDALRRRADSASTEKVTRPTAGELVTRIRRTFTGNAQSNDPTRQKILQQINNSVREIITKLGDKAWFLRHVETIQVTTSYPNLVTLPLVVDRVLRVEYKARPGTQVEFSMDGRTDAGRTRIRLPNEATGLMQIHCIVTVQDLVEDSDLCVIPNKYAELVEVLTCYRLSKLVKSPAGVSFDAGEMGRLWEMVQGDVHKYDRQRREAVEVTGSSMFTKYLARPGSPEWY